MKKIICLFVVFLVVGAANAADKWEYVHFTKTTDIGRNLTQFILAYPDGKKDVWSEKEIKPPKSFKDFAVPRFRALEQIDERVKFDKMLQKDFSQQINVVNALGKLGFEMSGNTLAVRNNSHHLRQSFWFKRKISK